MIRGFCAVYLREILILKRRIYRQMLSWSVMPLLYLIAFGYAMGRHVQMGDHSYLEFLIPGLVAMSSMTQAYAIAGEINIARFYWHIFEEFQVAPISNFSYVLGEVLAGITRAVLAVAVIVVLGIFFGVWLTYNVYFFLGLFLNSFVFASLAVTVAMLVKSHADQAMLSNFVITPMAFLGGTFFPLEHLPSWAQKILYYVPLTHAAEAIRAASFDRTPNSLNFFVLGGFGAIFFITAIACVNRARD